jgi:phosphoribosylanthranilate isomerase
MPVSRTRVKVCGLTRAVDARAAARSGADALGVILALGHRRSLTLDEAAEVLADVSGSVKRVGVFVDAPLAEVCDAVARLALDEVQLHGDEDPDYCAAVPAPVVKTLRVGPGFDPADVERYRGVVEAVLFDTLVEGSAGGNGRAFDWGVVAPLPDVAPVYVAGGLCPDNVGEVVRSLRPAGVDVSSGVEAGLGIKSPGMIDEFVAAVRAADRENEEPTRR